MKYEKLNFKDGMLLEAKQFNHMEDGIEQIGKEVEDLKEKGGKDGKTPVKGTDYFTEADKIEMVNAVIAALPVYGGETE